MRFHGGEALSWSRLERILSGRPGPVPVPVNHTRPLADAPTNYPEASHAPFAELHAVSSYSFLDGASEPEEMVRRARDLGITALALLDRDGFYGAVKFAEAAAEAGIDTVFGAELTLGDRVLPVLAKGPEGYRHLSHLIAAARMITREKDAVSYPPLELIAHELAGTCIVLAGWQWVDDIDHLVELFGGNVVREYEVSMTPEDADHHRALDDYPHVPAIVSAMPAAATRDDARLAAAKRALARRDCLNDAHAHLHPMGANWLRSAEQIEAMLPGAQDKIATALAIAAQCAFTLNLVAPELPRYPTPTGFDEMSWLRHITLAGAQLRYATRPDETRAKAMSQIDYELGVIEELNFPGYFLIVHDLVDFARRENILCQGRGSAANSAVCFALGITNAEPISAGLLFERFLSPDRDGPPDIDIDIESGRREEVIQYAYERYGRDNAAQVANVITYRTKGAIRDAARALGYAQGAADSWSKGISRPPEGVEKLASQLKGQPRHLGIHSGGMVICDRPIADVVPVEWARMENRSVVQWDKDDCASAGLVKFDLLGLGMLEALHHMIDLVRDTAGREVNLWELDVADARVYEMLCRADAVGVFQVESRAQLSTLPRLKPRCFFDLVVEVALIRPGPIQGGSVHPYLRRRDGKEAIVYDHPVLEKSLGKTLGIPLFQEQLMQIAVDAAGFSGREADALRRAMGSKRSPEKMAQLKERFFDGCWATNRIDHDVAETLWAKIVAFAAYGFPESHSQSFASLVFFSAWFKCYYPAQFCVGLLRAQPMGFYSPQSLIQDARRHGIEVLPVSVNDSGREAICVDNATIRVGLNLIKGLGDKAADRIEAAQPFRDIPDLSRRADLSVEHVEALARAGALDCFGVDRRQALWQAGVAATEREGMLPGLSAIEAPALPGMNAFELMVADIGATGVTHDKQPMELLRERLRADGLVTAAGLKQVEDGTRVRVAGVVTHRQRPRTASGVTFFGMEDETGLINVVVSPGLWKRQLVLARTAKALIVRGIVENVTGAVNVVADKLEPLELGEYLNRGSRDFH
ncbi:MULTISPECIES: error-prone DNA polymerase [Corynebacterium]|uniref:Error-prone DNA polymerase n=1 Tax=Corynebacterium lipophiloflavum (strain ATCC 700352 / DSM 44291 / CCUG 37336 / JCM 10383 / DMMZ 1944) TaxID=525263 RepID=C0XUW8_CORLD|nr:MULTISPECIES: error-prone DNA polymerase [Corynebacterium]EEI15984.1 DNA polymerase III, alpha subunit [Corynebacterium lipophiloflavum DSM 44291]MCT2154207.1 error-prone DNA polymerase [Corynebacterium sanguinis]